MRTITSLVSLVAILLVFGFMPASAMACSIPVFRFGLEAWQPDPYTVIVLHDGELTGEAAEVVRSLDSDSDADNPVIRPNLLTLTADLADDETPQPYRDLWQNLGEPALPMLVVKFPLVDHIDYERYAPFALEDFRSAEIGPTEDVLYTGPVTRESLDKVTRSPVRDRIARRLVQGESAVWLLIESGDREADEEAAAMLEKMQRRFESEFELPEVSEEDRWRYMSESEHAPPLHLKFSTVRVRHDDPDEQMLLRQLYEWPAVFYGEESIDPSEGPIVAPIYGRGRLHNLLQGQWLTEDNLSTAMTFLCGMCSCEIKRDNPGVDLLFTAGWNDFVAPGMERARGSFASLGTESDDTGEPQGEAQDADTAPPSDAALIEADRFAPELTSLPEAEGDEVEQAQLDKLSTAGSAPAEDGDEAEGPEMVYLVLLGVGGGLMLGGFAGLVIYRQHRKPGDAAPGGGPA